MPRSEPEDAEVMGKINQYISAFTLAAVNDIDKGEEVGDALKEYVWRMWWQDKINVETRRRVRTYVSELIECLREKEGCPDEPESDTSGQ